MIEIEAAPICVGTRAAGGLTLNLSLREEGLAHHMPADTFTNTPTLTDLAAEINAALREVDSSRLHAGRLLLQAREIFEAGKAQGDSWRAWCAVNIPDRSIRDIKRVMSLARSSDPTAALAQERDRARRAMAEKRAREAAAAVARVDEGTNVSPPPETVRIGKQEVDVSGWGDAAKAQITAALAPTPPEAPSEVVTPSAPITSPKERYSLLPPRLRTQINAEYGYPADVCPHPRPSDFDALSPDFEWPANALCHPLFMLADCDDSEHGPSAFVARAIKEHQLYGKQIVFVLPIPHPLNLLLQAGAQVHPIPEDGDEVYPAGRVHWRDTATGEPMPSPGAVAVFVLPGSRRDEDAHRSVREAGGCDNATLVENDDELTTAAIPAERGPTDAATSRHGGHTVSSAAPPAEDGGDVALPAVPVGNDEPRMPAEAAAAPAGDNNAGGAPTSDDQCTVAIGAAAADDDEPSVTIAAPPVDDGVAAAEPADASQKRPARASLVKQDQVRTSRIAPNYGLPRPGSGRAAKNNGLACVLRGGIGCQHPVRCQAEGACLERALEVDNVSGAA